MRVGLGMRGALGFGLGGLELIAPLFELVSLVVALGLLLGRSKASLGLDTVV